MTVIYRCDQCQNPIDKDAHRFAVDVQPADEPEPDEDGLVPLLTLTTDAEFHFCSAGCLATWAFDRGLEDGP